MKDVLTIFDVLDSTDLEITKHSFGFEPGLDATGRFNVRYPGYPTISLDLDYEYGLFGLRRKNKVFSLSYQTENGGWYVVPNRSQEELARLWQTLHLVYDEQIRRVMLDLYHSLNLDDSERKTDKRRVLEFLKMD